MYRRYLNLYNNIKDYITKMSEVIKDDPDKNAVIKVVSDNLTEVRTAMYDYMIMKYQKSTYVQVRLFYETIITIVKLNFELLRNNKITLSSK